MTATGTWTKNANMMSGNSNRLVSTTLIVFSCEHRTVDVVNSEMPVGLVCSDYDLSFDFFFHHHLYGVFVLNR
jgi:hypothetical protein